MTIVEDLSLFQHLNNAFFDFYMRERAGIIHRHNEDLVLIQIDDCDYQRIFDSTSPLDPLQVMSLIKVIQSAGPRVIGVDLDTRSEKWRGMWDRFKKEVRSPIIWAVPKRIGAKEEIEPDDALGGDSKNFQGVVLTALALLPQDEDAVVRKYRDKFSSYVAFHREISQKFDPKLPPSTEMEYYIDFSPTTIPVGSLPCDKEIHVGSFTVGYARDYLEEVGWKKTLSEIERSKLKDKVVLISGTFAAARDSYQTPLGEMTGLELIANVIESDLKLYRVQGASMFCQFVIDVVAGLFIVGVYAWWRNCPGTALVISLLCTLLPVALGLVLVSVMPVWLNAAPIMFGMIFHEKTESTHTAAEPKGEEASLAN